MTKKIVGYVELEWPCPNCGNRNPGPQMKCATCGFPQPEDVDFQQAAQDVLIEDRAEIERARRGPDIHCPYCGTRNLAGTERCKQCGGDLTDAQARSRGRVVGALHTEEAPPVICPSCGTENPAIARKCSNCGANLLAARPKPEPKRRPVPANRPTLGRLIPILLVVLVACVGIFLFLNLRTSALAGEVSDVQWTRSIAVEALMPVTRQDWRTEIPAGAEIGACRQKLHHTEPEPVPDSVEVCGTPYVVDTGTGHGEVVQDCEYQVFADWCEYTALAWRAVEPIVSEGRDLSPQWPAVLLGEGQREGGRSEQYVVTFATDGKDYRYTLRSAEQFAQFTPGSRWQLEVNALGAVVGVEPVR